jgi:hypothetical protein
MVGTSGLSCGGFIEGPLFPGSKEILRRELAERGEEISDRQIDDRLEAIEWAIEHDDDESVRRIPGRNLWVAVTPGFDPVLRVLLRPRPDLPEECELLWIEERLD